MAGNAQRRAGWAFQRCTEGQLRRWRKKGNGSSQTGKGSYTESHSFIFRNEADKMWGMIGTGNHKAST